MRRALLVLACVACSSHHTPTISDPTYAVGDLRRIRAALARERDSICTGRKAVPAGVDSALLVHCAPPKAVRDSVCGSIYARPLSPDRDSTARVYACPQYRPQYQAPPLVRPLSVPYVSLNSTGNGTMSDALTGAVTLTNARCWEIYDALTTLGRRKCPLINSDLKVARLIKWIEPYAHPIQSARNGIPARVLNGRQTDGLTPVDVQLINFAISGEQEALDAATVDLPPAPRSSGVPLVLRQADLPKEQTGDLGWKNADSLGIIVAHLDFLYEFAESDGA